MSYSLADTSNAYARALSVARGSYQRNIVAGIEALSGATLRGKARKWSGVYARSRANLLGRLTEAGIPWREVRGARAKRILVIGAGPVGDGEARCA